MSIDIVIEARAAILYFTLTLTLLDKDPSEAWTVRLASSAAPSGGQSLVVVISPADVPEAAIEK